VDALLAAPLEVLIWYVGALDRVPDFARAMLAGGLLVALLAWSRRKVPVHDVQFSMSFWKVSLVVLVVAPLGVWLLPASRLSVFVEDLQPLTPSAGLAWLAVLCIWAGGFLIGLAGMIHQLATSARAALAAPVVPEDDKLAQRLRHWQRRLGTSPQACLALTTDDRPSQVPGVPRLLLPRAAAHWPAAATDLLVIQALCRQKKHQGAWYLFAQTVACAYWPMTWVRQVAAGLLHDFHVAADNLAAACFQDEPGYHRALRQLEQRLTTPAGPGERGRSQVESARGSRLAAPTAYLQEVRATLRPQSTLRWDAAALSTAYERRRYAVWSEPGEKLAWLIGQSLLVALVVSSVTLREEPPEIERDFSITLDPSWMNTAFPDPARFAPPSTASQRRGAAAAKAETETAGTDESAP